MNFDYDTTKFTSEKQDIEFNKKILNGTLFKNVFSAI